MGENMRQDPQVEKNCVIISERNWQAELLMKMFTSGILKTRIGLFILTKRIRVESVVFSKQPWIARLL